MKFKYSISKELQSFDSKILFRQIDFKNLSCFKAGMVDQPAVRSQPDNTEVIFDLDGNIPDIQCLPVKADEIVEVSLQDDGGWTLARKQEKQGFFTPNYCNSMLTLHFISH